MNRELYKNMYSIFRRVGSGMRGLKTHLSAWIAAIAVLVLLNAFSPAFAEESGMVRVWLTRLGSNPTVVIRPTCEYYVSDMPLRRIPADTTATFALNNGSIAMTVGDATVSFGSTVRLNRSQSGKEGAVFPNLGSTNRYCGDLILTTGGSGILIVLDIYVEDYLYGVVGYEMSPSYSTEALKAQAVAARNYALKKQRSRTKYAYDLTDNASNQVYKGLDVSSKYTSVIQAVDATRGQVLYYGSSLANCYYGASNGGQIESTKNAWGSALAYSVVKDDPYDYTGAGKVKTATIRKDAGNLNAQLKQALQNGVLAIAQKNGITVSSVKIDSIDAIALTDARFSAPSRLYQTAVFTLTATISKASGETATGSCEVRVPVYGGIETWYGLSINSGNNETVWIESNASSFTLRMGRNGHGIGLSQTGAQVMARDYAKSCSEILAFYYPGCTLKSISLYDTTGKANLPNAAAVAQTGAQCPLYETPETGANRILTIHAGETIQIYAVKNEWVAVAYGNTAGYVLAENISLCVPVGETMRREDNLYARVNVSNGTLRSLPLEGANNIANLNRETIVRVYMYTENWAAVATVDGKRGYMRLNSLQRMNETVPEPTTTPTPVPTPEADQVYTISGERYARVIESSTMLYSGIGADSKALLTLSKGESVRVYAYNRAWVASQTMSGTTGYIPIHALQLLPEEEQQIEGGDVQAVKGTVYRYVSSASAKIYSSYSTNSNVLGTFAYGTRMQIGAYNAAWAFVKVNGKYGFVSVHALTDKSPVSNSVEDVIWAEFNAVTTKNAYAYAQPNRKRAAIGMFSKGEKVRVYAYNNAFAYVRSGKYAGFVAISDLRITI